MSETTQKKNAASKPLHVLTIHTLLWALLLAVAGVFITFTASWATYQAKVDAEAETDVFKTFSLKTLDGGTLEAQELSKTALTAINIWGTDCPPCIGELPDLETLNNSYDDSQFRMIGIPIDVTTHGKEIIEDRLKEANRILEASNVTYVNLIADEKMDTFVKSIILGTPTTFFIDKEGEIIYTVTGSRDLDYWKNTVDELLKERKQ